MAHTDRAPAESPSENGRAEIAPFESAPKSHKRDMVVDLRDDESFLGGIVDIRSTDVETPAEPAPFSQDGAAAEAGAVIRVLPGHEGGRLSAALPWQMFVKRVVDVIGATLALTVLFPILLATALAVRLTSPGPIIHRQIRIGQDGDPFVFLKFRSMYVDAEHLKKSLTQYNEAEGPIFKIKQDPRITPVGRWIRKLSIDEMPQLLHVLTGQMSLVGPRPHLPEEVAVYDGEARRRLAVRPGVTGIWQVSGRSDLDFDTWIAMDLEYLDHWSLWLDCKLMARTFAAVLSGRGAY